MSDVADILNSLGANLSLAQAASPFTSLSDYWLAATVPEEMIWLLQQTGSQDAAKYQKLALYAAQRVLYLLDALANKDQLVQPPDKTRIVVEASNSSPIVLTCPGHGFLSGITVAVSGCEGNTAANGTWVNIQVLDFNHFTLPTSQGNGTYAGNGLVSPNGLLSRFALDRLFLHLYVKPRTDLAQAAEDAWETVRLQEESIVDITIWHPFLAFPRYFNSPIQIDSRKSLNHIAVSYDPVTDLPNPPQANPQLPVSPGADPGFWVDYTSSQGDATRNLDRVQYPGYVYAILDAAQCAAWACQVHSPYEAAREAMDLARMAFRDEILWVSNDWNYDQGVPGFTVQQQLRVQQSAHVLNGLFVRQIRALWGNPFSNANVLNRLRLKAAQAA